MGTADYSATPLGPLDGEALSSSPLPDCPFPILVLYTARIGLVDDIIYLFPMLQRMGQHIGFDFLLLFYFLS